MNNSTPETGYWVICPVCLMPNPAGTSCCKHCWGASLGSEKSIPAQELEGMLKRRRSRDRRQRLFSGIAHGIFFACIFGATVFYILYNYTGLLFPPKEIVNSGSLPGEWAMFRHDLSHTGSGGSGGAQPRGIKKWIFAAGGAIHSSPAVANGTVYFGSRDGRLYALDAATGSKRWEYRTGSWVESSPAVVDGAVYFGSNDGILYALDAGTGEKRWEFSTPYSVMSSPAVANGVVYFGADDYSVYAVDSRKGKKIWKVAASAPVQSSPAIAGGIVYIGSGGEYVYAINARTGKVRLNFYTEYPVLASPLVTYKTVIFANYNGYLYGLDANARNWYREHRFRPMWLQLWAFGLPIPEPPLHQSGFMWSMKLDRYIASSPVLKGNSLYIGSDSGLFAIDIKNRRIEWSFKTRGPVTSSPAVNNGTVYAGSKDCRLYAVDAATGKKLWEFLTGGEITSSPAAADGTVYIGSHDGKLYAIK